RLSVYTEHLEELERYLPHDDRYKRPIKGLSSPMVVVTDIYRGGDIATGYQPVAANLPNDPRVHTTKGTKKTFWKNVMDARVRHVIMPIGREIIASDQVRYITPQGLFNFVLLHELSHALGPRYIHGSADEVSVNQALADLYPAIEEGKADVAGLHSMQYFIEAGIIAEEMEKEQYVSYLASLFRTIRFGTSEAHGKAAICQINYLWDKGGIHRDNATGKWSVVFDSIGPAVTALAREWLTIQAEGAYDRAEEFFGTWGRTPREVQQSLDGLEHVPVDVEPVYSIIWD
ncbi:MAG: Zn-dependent hydrolase, partial [Ignavibacteria bacterium]|nr:Zn-dependent hydrolase [Ignavibacteria bacterium]